MEKGQKGGRKKARESKSSGIKEVMFTREEVEHRDKNAKMHK